jgi:preprotein translocase subunit SecF
MTQQNNTPEILNNLAILFFIPVIIGVLSSLITLWFTVWTNKKQKEDDEKQKIFEPLDFDN